MKNKLKANESDADESDLQTQSESEDELILQHQPTRSGRLPKVPDKFQAEESLPISPSTINITRRPAKVVTVDKKKKKNDIQGRSDPIEPGSIMIMCEKGSSGEPVYKIYMVTPQQSATPVNLAPDAIARAIKFKKGIAAENIITISANNTDDEEDLLPEENNYTIPADENVTTLRSNPVTDEETEESKNMSSMNLNKESNDEYILPDDIPESEQTRIFRNSPAIDEENDAIKQSSVIESQDIKTVSDTEVEGEVFENNPDTIQDGNASPVDICDW